MGTIAIPVPVIAAGHPERTGHGNKIWRWLIAIGALAAVGGGIFYFATRAPAVSPYATAKVDRGDIDAIANTTGSLNAVVTVQVGSQVSGNIIALYADFNTKVKKGQLVAAIDPAPFQASVDQATGTLNAAIAAARTSEANVGKTRADLAAGQANVLNQQGNLAKARSALELAQVDNTRKATMLREGIGTHVDADAAESVLQQAVAGVDSALAGVSAAQAAVDSSRKAIDVARSQMDQAGAVVKQDAAVLSQEKLNLSHTKILAPVDGTVQARNMDVGQTVAASFSAPVIFLIAQDMTKMQVDTNVDESDMGAIQEGQPAKFTVDAYPGQTFNGTVGQVRHAPINVQNVITYDVVVNVSNPELKLFPGMTANVTILTGHRANVLRLPKTALRFRPRSASGRPQAVAGGPGAVVYVLNAKGEPEAVRVTTGLSDANRVELVGGGVVEGQLLVTGSAVKPGTAPAPSGGGGRRLGF